MIKTSTWLRGQAVKTSPFHGGNTGSIPVGVTPLSLGYADVAQLAEQLICNQQVIGSSPIIGCKYALGTWTFSSVGESSRLITGRSWVRVPEGPLFVYCLAQWLSWLERRPVTAEAVGSSPSWVVFLFK